MRRFVPFAIAITVLVGLFATFAFFAGDNWDRDRHDTAQVIQVVPAGSDATTGAVTGNTIVIERDHRHFFPFGFFLFPLFFFGIFFVARAFAGPRRWNGGWEGRYPPDSNPPAWFDQWHRDAHGQRSEPTAQATPPAPPSANESDATPS